MQVLFGGVQNRGETENEPRHDADPDGKEEDPGVQGDLRSPRDAGVSDGLDQLKPALGQEQPELCADESKHNALSCRKLAPRAPRIAISRWRASARASNRLATLTQAISSTKKTAPNNICKAGLTLRTTSFCRP